MSGISMVKKKGTCPICKGAEIIYQPSGRSKNISYLEVCKCVEEKCICDKKPPYLYKLVESNTLRQCSCKKSRTKIENIHRLFKISNIPNKYLYRRLTEFTIENPESDTELYIALDFAMEFVNLFKKSQQHPNGLYFFGTTGTGKTMLSCLILNEIIFRYQEQVRYIKITRDFFNRIRASFNVESATYGRGDDIFHTLAEQEVLVIDDLGVQADSEWEKRTLYDLIDARYESQKPTIITSNVQPDDWSGLFDGRVFSRLKEMVRFLPMITDDYRNRYVNKA
ncbi:MAG: ATP-binding protein [Leptospirales bacterium]